MAVDNVISRVLQLGLTDLATGEEKVPVFLVFQASFVMKRTLPVCIGEYLWHEPLKTGCSSTGFACLECAVVTSKALVGEMKTLQSLMCHACTCGYVLL